MINKLMNLLVQTQPSLYREVLEVFSEHIIDERNGYYVLADPYPDVKHKPLLLCHLDTCNMDHNVMFKHEIVHTEIERVIGISDNYPGRCLGGDDRCGVYLAKELYANREENKTKFAYLFLFDEEIGLIGSREFGRSGLWKNYGCFIGLDRKSGNGGDEVAAYGFDNDELFKIFEGHGFKKTEGTITDCSEVSEATLTDDDTAVACLNMSVGYDHEHTKNEIIHLDALKRSLETLKEIEIPLKSYECEYVEQAWWGNYRGFGNGRRYDVAYGQSTNLGYFDPFPVICDVCHEHEKLYETEFGTQLCDSCKTTLENQ